MACTILLNDAKSYELQLHESIQQNGIGGQFMQVLEHVGLMLGLSKSMLTVFSSNSSALSFYTKLGYQPPHSLQYCRYTRDPISPSPRILRSNHIILPDYQILSKRLNIA